MKDAELNAAATSVPAPTTAELLEAWRDATRAAELAERLAELASDAAGQADRNAVASEQIADMAEKASRAADQAATKAREAAAESRRLAIENREGRLRTADAVSAQAKADETAAKHLYHRVEDEARDRQERRDGR